MRSVSLRLLAISPNLRPLSIIAMIGPTRSLLIIALAIRICHAHRPVRRVFLLEPSIAHCGDGEESAKQVIGQACDDEASEKVEVVDIGRTLGDWLSDGADKPDDVDHDTSNVSGVSAPRPAEPIEVRASAGAGVKIFELEVALANDVVVADDNASDTGEEDGVGG
jgi:hypothetical protein